MVVGKAIFSIDPVVKMPTSPHICIVISNHSYMSSELSAIIFSYHPRQAGPALLHCNYVKLLAGRNGKLLYINAGGISRIL